MQLALCLIINNSVNSVNSVRSLVQRTEDTIMGAVCDSSYESQESSLNSYLLAAIDDRIDG